MDSMNKFRLALILTLSIDSWASASTREYSVEHKFSADAEFTNRGTLECSTSSSKLQCTIDNHEDLASSFNSLLGHGFYYLRLCDKERGCVQTFIKQCLLVESGLQEIVEVSSSPSHDIIGVALLTPVPACNGTGLAGGIANFARSSLRTRVEVMEPLAPAEPETSLYIKRVEEEKKKLKGDGEDNRSFIAKYWMYIVPVMLLFMLSSQGEQGGE